MNEFSTIDGGELNLPVLAHAGVPPYQPTSDAAVAAFRDLMLKRAPDVASVPPAKPNTQASETSAHALRAAWADAAAEGAEGISRLAPAHPRVAAPPPW